MSFLGGLHGETSKVKAEVEEDAEILFLPRKKVCATHQNTSRMVGLYFQIIP